MSLLLATNAGATRAAIARCQTTGCRPKRAQVDAAARRSLFVRKLLDTVTLSGAAAWPLDRALEFDDLRGREAGLSLA